MGKLTEAIRDEFEYQIRTAITIGRFAEKSNTPLQKSTIKGAIDAATEKISSLVEDVEVVRGWYESPLGSDLLVLGKFDNYSRGRIRSLDTDDLYCAHMAGGITSTEYVVTARSLRENGYTLSRYIDDEGGWHEVENA